MIFGKRNLLYLVSLSAALALQRADAEIDSARLIERIKVIAPAAIKFTEVRFSRLLKQPTVVSGELGYLGADRLDRNIDRPYSERTEIRSSTVKVTRDGEPVRSFGLDRTPELRVLLRTFSSLLDGNREALERDFQMTAAGNGEDWTLNLVPLDSRLKRRLDRVAITGRNEAPQCFSIFTHDGGITVMLLGQSSAVALSPPITLESVQKHCEPAANARP
jgi:hypothetical protein